MKKYNRRIMRNIEERRWKNKVNRKNRLYVRGRWSGEHQPIRNRKFKLLGKSRGSAVIQLPRRLSADQPQDVLELVGILESIKDATLHQNLRRLVIDQSELAEVAPEAALLVAAEIHRCDAYCSGRTEITGTYPRSHAVAEMLTEFGFYSALGVRAPVLPVTYSLKTYAQVKRGNEIMPRVIDALIECFSRVFDFSREARRALHVALIECMDNVFEHAYAMRGDDPYLFREWWLAGFADQEEGKIGFVFFDQGDGIPTTIKTKKRGRVLRALKAWDDSNWIERAIRKPISRHDSARRGHGLEKLKKFIDNLWHEGVLRVMSNRGSVVFRSGARSAELMPLPVTLNGTLVSWEIRGVSVVIDDLTPAGSIV